MYVIQGLTQMAENHGKAVKCIKDCYNRPRVTHHEHVWSILQAPIMNGNNGKELSKLYDTCKQQLWAIYLSNHFYFETFLTITMELKMEEVMKFKL